MNKRKYVIGIITVLFIIIECSTGNAILIESIQSNNKITEQIDIDLIVFVEGGTDIKIRFIFEEESDFDLEKLAFTFYGPGFIINPDARDYVDKNLEDGRKLFGFSIDFITVPSTYFFTFVISYDNEIIISISGRVIRQKVTFNNKPKVDFTFSMENLVLSVDASNCIDPDGGEIMYYLWDWGDGAVSMTTEPITTHAYDQEKTYKVSLTAIDDEFVGTTISKETKKGKTFNNIFFDCLQKYLHIFEFIQRKF